MDNTWDLTPLYRDAAAWRHDFDRLPAAVADNWLRRRAMGEYDFEPYHADPRWAETFGR